MRKIIVTALCVVLAGCAAERKQEVYASYHSFLGRPVSALAASLGPPDNQLEMGDGTRWFRWEKEGLFPARRWCHVSVIASTSKSNPSLDDWLIRRWEVEGNACL
jgi:hypothetical protein